MKWLIILFVLFSTACQAQHYKMHPGIPVDSSFNIKSEFNKQLKNFPGISIAGTGDTSMLTIYHDLVYTRYKNRELHLDLFFRRNPGSNKLPVIIFIHGGGWRSGDKSMDWPMAAEFARKSYATVCVEYRLSMESLYPAGIMDVKTAIRWLRANYRKYPVDKDRFALAGTSSGGQMATLIGTINGTEHLYKIRSHRCISDKVQAVVDIDGVLAFIHPESGEGADKPGKPSAGTMWFGASSAEKPELWNEASALTHVNPRSAPVLFINSALPRFHAGRDDHIRKLESLCIYCETHTIGNTPHTFWLFYPWFSDVIDLTDKFLKRTL